MWYRQNVTLNCAKLNADMLNKLTNKWIIRSDKHVFNLKKSKLKTSGKCSFNCYEKTSTN